MKKTITKILSILCLVAVLVCGFTMPCMKLTGDYQSIFALVDTIATAIPEEARASIEQLLEGQGITIDLDATLESVTKLLEPIKDGEIALQDFVTISQSCTDVANQLSVLPAEGIANPFEGIEVPEQMQSMVQMYESANSMIKTAAQIAAFLPLISYAILAPVGLFGIFAFFVALRIILRLFNRRGLGVGITFLAMINAAFMIGLPVVVAMYAANGLTFGLEATYVPYIMVGGCIVNCIIWAIGRGKKVKKEEVVVEAPVVEEATVEETVVEEAVVEEVVEAAEEVEAVEVEETVEE